MSIDTDYTSSTYDSFMSIATADALIAAREMLTGESSGWSLLDDDHKESHLKEATRLVNSLEWEGSRNENIVVPLMEWPRSGLYEPTGEEIDETEIPDQILNYMVCLISYRLITGDPEAPAPGSGIQSKTVDKISITYRGSGSGKLTGMDSCQKTWIPPEWIITGLSCMGVGSSSKMRCP
jgi:hypothetical protein